MGRSLAFLVLIFYLVVVLLARGEMDDRHHNLMARVSSFLSSLEGSR